jgi:hypothetical protein
MDSDKLISLVRERAGLWDRDHPAHRSTNAQSELWDEVAREMDSTVDEVRIKWRKFRNSFMGIRNRLRARGCRFNDMKFSNFKTWRLYRRLSFLSAQYRPNATTVGIEHEQEETLNNEDGSTREGRNSQFRGSGQKHKLSTKVRNIGNGEKLSAGSVAVKEQCTPLANSTYILAKRKKSLDAQTCTQNGELQNPKLSKMESKTSVVMDVSTEAVVSLYLNQQLATMNMELIWAIHNTSLSYQADVYKPPAQVMGPNMEESEKELEVREEDA